MVDDPLAVVVDLTHKGNKSTHVKVTNEMRELARLVLMLQASKIDIRNKAEQEWTELKEAQDAADEEEDRVWLETHADASSAPFVRVARAGHQVQSLESLSGVAYLPTGQGLRQTARTSDWSSSSALTNTVPLLLVRSLRGQL